MRPPGSLVPPAAGPPCRQGSPKEPLRATAGKVRRSAKNASQGRSFPFLSTLPARGATRPSHRRWSGPNISIHALRKGSDPGRVGCGARKRGDFYPRSPQGERPQPSGRPCMRDYFYPHSPEGERREGVEVVGPAGLFLSTLPGRGATRPYNRWSCCHHYFYPHSPEGERR